MKVILGLLFFICGCLACILGWLLLHQSDYSIKPQPQTLSERAKEFIVQRRQDEHSEWNMRLLHTPAPQILGEQSFSTTCFSVSLPWLAVEEDRIDSNSGCTLQLNILQKRMRVIYHVQPYLAKLTEFPGVRLRLQDTITYTQEAPFVFSDIDSVVAFEKGDNTLHTISISGGIERARLLLTVAQLQHAITYAK